MITAKKYSPLTARLLRNIGDRIATQDKKRGRLCILNYHRVLPSPDPLLHSEPDIDTFRWQMELLAECFHVLPLHDAITALGREPMPPRALCITFDDGYRSTHDLALPILNRLGLPATVFVTTGYLEHGNMWNDRILEAIRRLPTGSLNLQDVGLGTYLLQTDKDRCNLAHKLTIDTKYLPPDARIKVSKKLENLAGNVVTEDLMLTAEMVAALARNGMEIGGHTVSHPILTSLDNDTARQEIIDGKRQLERITGKPVRLFAYPNGKAGVDFDDRHVQIAKEAGFAAAFTTAMGAATAQHDRHQIPRCRPWDASPFFFGLRLLRWLAGKPI